MALSNGNSPEWLNHPYAPESTSPAVNALRAETPPRIRQRRKWEAEEKSKHRQRLHAINKVVNDFPSLHIWESKDTAAQAKIAIISQLHRQVAADDWRGVMRTASGLGPHEVDSTLPGYKTTALAHAVALGNSRVVRALLQCGADPHQGGVDARGEPLTGTPARLLLEAVDALAIRTVAELIAGGASTRHDLEEALGAVQGKMRALGMVPTNEKEASGGAVYDRTPVAPTSQNIWSGAYVPQFYLHSELEQLQLRRLECLLKAGPEYAVFLTNGFIEMSFERAGKRDEALRVVQRVAARKLDGVGDITTIGH